jgi:hypothetical protein
LNKGSRFEEEGPDIGESALAKPEALCGEVFEAAA